MSTEHSYDRGGVTDREGVTYWWSEGEGYSCKLSLYLSHITISYCPSLTHPGHTVSTEHSYDGGGVTDREGVTYWWSEGEGYSCKFSLYFSHMTITGDKNISILHLSCRSSELQFSTHPANTCTCPLKAYAIKNIKK